MKICGSFFIPLLKTPPEKCIVQEILKETKFAFYKDFGVIDELEFGYT